MLYQQGPHNGSNMGTRMHSYPIYQDYQQKAEPLAEVLCRRLVPASVSVDNQTERVAGGDGIRQLLHDARRASRRSGACSIRRKTTRCTTATRSWCSATTTGPAASPAILP